MVKFGNWIYHYRNYLFPLFYLALFIPSKSLTGNTHISEIAGLAVIVAGISVRCITIGLVYIVRGGRKRAIYADDLVTGGIYSICRNPMYLGNILLLLGFGIFADSLLFIAIFFPLFVIFYIAIIKAEEAFLLNKFGDSFSEYMKKTNALLPDLRNLPGAFSGQRFKWKKVVSKEHNSLYLYLVGIFLLQFYRKEINLTVFLILFAATTVIYIIIKWMKKQQMLNE